MSLGGEHGGEDAPQVRLLHRQVGPRHSRTAPPRRLVCGRLQRQGGHEGRYRGGRQGGLREVDRGEGGVLGPSRRRWPNEERLESGLRRSLERDPVGAPPPSRPDLRTYRIGTSRDPAFIVPSAGLGPAWPGRWWSKVEKSMNRLWIVNLYGGGKASPHGTPQPHPLVQPKAQHLRMARSS